MAVQLRLVQCNGCVEVAKRERSSPQVTQINPADGSQASATRPSLILNPASKPPLNHNNFSKQQSPIHIPQMAPPSPLAIATGSVQRLVKEETSYHKELKNQEARLEKLVNSTEENENKEYQLKQEVYRPSSYLTLPYYFSQLE